MSESDFITKICTGCGRELPATLEFFGRKKRGLYGLRSRCKSCECRDTKSRYVPRPLPTVEDRLWAQIQQGPEDECWPWLGSANAKGYGRIYANGRTRVVSQVVWESTHGQPFPRGKEACHTCDNPGCANPKHIFAGTHTENMRDCKAKGRQRFLCGDDHPHRKHPDRVARGLQNGSHTKPERRPKGESHGCHKLTENQVRDMRALYAAGGVTHRELARRFGVSKATATFAINGRHWKHLDQGDTP